MILFQNLETLPDDPIFGLSLAFQADPRADKVNLGVGSYKDADGHPCVFSSVRQAEHILLDKRQNKEYLPILGDKKFCKLLGEVVFGQQKSQITLSCQTAGGTNALRISAELLARAGYKKIFLPDPTWANHKLIFSQTPLAIDLYPYYSPSAEKINLSAILQAIDAMPEHSAILLHSCCHNPTGFDPAPEEWEEICHAIKQKKVFPLFDSAYQGFGQGLEEDAAAMRLFCRESIPFFAAYSCAKNFGLYGERVGALFLLNLDEAEQKISSNLKQIIRSSISNPPIHGSQIVAEILDSAELTKEWKHELSNISLRVKEMRSAFAAALLSAGPPGRFDFIHYQQGMFSYSGLNSEQVKRLKDEKGIFMPSNGRVNVAGLNWNNLDRVVDAIVSVVEA